MEQPGIGAIDEKVENYEYSNIPIEKMADLPASALGVIDAEIANEGEQIDVAYLDHIIDQTLDGFSASYEEALKDVKTLPPEGNIMPVPIFKDGDLPMFIQSTTDLAKRLDELNQKYSMPSYLKHSIRLRQILNNAEMYLNDMVRKNSNKEINEQVPA